MKIGQHSHKETVTVRAPLHFGARTSDRGTVGNGPVLLAFSRDRLTTADVRRACRFCQALDAELHILHVAATEVGLHPRVPHLRVMDSAKTIEAVASMMGALQDDVVELAQQETIQLGDLALRFGCFVEHAASYAASTGAQYLMLPASETRIGVTASRLARRSMRPVVVPRDDLVGRSIVAATDLQSHQFPIVQTAADLGRQIGGPVRLLHDCIEAARSGRRSTGESRSLIERRRAILLHLSKRLEIGREPVVAAERDPVDAIMHELAVGEADVAIVGTRGGWSQFRHPDMGVAERIITSAGHSVIVAPIREPNDG